MYYTQDKPEPAKAKHKLCQSVAGRKGPRQLFRTQARADVVADPNQWIRSMQTVIQFPGPSVQSST